jgi:Fic family protein
VIGQQMSDLETPFGIEPTRLEEPSEAMADLVAEIASASTALGRALHPKIAANLASLVRVMNCYYSNLIEGHNTPPRDIERSLAGDFDASEERRNLQIEAAAHVRVQAEIDAMAANGTLPEPASQDFILWLHRAFYRDAPEEMLRIGEGSKASLMTPGAWRSRAGQDVAVGRHIPLSSDRVPDFMNAFEGR